MTKENKYYTPEVSEFYVGFEFQGKILGDGNKDEDKWINLIYSIPTDGIFCKNSDGEIWTNESLRVKCLDIEDIESFNFELSEEIDPMFGKHIYYKQEERNPNEMSESYATWKLIHMQGKIMITQKSDGWFNNPEKTLFYGKIKNKSELKRLLVQLKINES